MINEEERQIRIINDLIGVFQIPSTPLLAAASDDDGK
jgi:hypothetical protein